MRFRPANISLINRRHYLPRLLLILSSIEKDDQRTLTGHYISTSGLPTIRNVWSSALPQAKNESDGLVCANVFGLCWSVGSGPGWNALRSVVH